MVRGRFYSGQDDLTDILNIRRQVFVEELMIPADVEDDGRDDYCMHVIALDGETPVAMGRISYDGFEFEISRVAVLPDYRCKKFGDFIVRMLIDKAMMSQATEVCLDAFEETIPFFETIGFVAKGENGTLGDRKLVRMTLDTGSIHKCCNCK